MKKKLFTLLTALGFTLTSFNTYLIADEKQNNKNSNFVDKQTDNQNRSAAQWVSPKEAAEKTNPIKSDKKSITKGAKTFATLCIDCHGEKALGNGVLAASLNPKPTNLRAVSGKFKDGDFAWKITNGRNAMPAWNGILSENDIWNLVNFIQNLKNQKQNSKSSNTISNKSIINFSFDSNNSNK